MNTIMFLSGSKLTCAFVFLSLTLGCADDPSVERKGGPLPDAGSGGGLATGGSDGGATVGGEASEEGVSFCNALIVIRNKCQRCHGDPLRNSAPVPFLTYEDTQARYYMSNKRWWEIMIPSVEQDFMPYVALNDPPGIMPPVEPLTAEEKATLLGWLEQGAKPEGGTDCP
ncbi:MAG: hypothetical protein EOO73_31125 [Myxococcales bacterium]|nr:MAG: hypothetical protein EOO73_31125 [Myxococcales bacterium]